MSEQTPDQQPEQAPTEPGAAPVEHDAGPAEAPVEEAPAGAETPPEPELEGVADDQASPETEVGAEVEVSAGVEEASGAEPETEVSPEIEEGSAPEPETEVEAAPEPEPEPETQDEATPDPEPEPETQDEAAPEPEPKTAPAPAAPRPGMPSPAMFAARKPAAPRPPAAAGTGSVSTPDSPTPAPSAAPVAPSDSVKHGRVGEDGTVYVIAADGSERAVGSYPGASPEDALAYFARKYDELAASADLLKARLASTEVSAHDARQSLAHLKEQIGEAHVVGDLAALQETVAHLEQEVSTRSAAETAARAEAKATATVEREAIVAKAEKLAAKDPASIQWKQSSARVRELLEEWKTHQRSGPRLDKDVESALWQRFSAARSSFDKARKAWFAQLDDQHAEAKRVKERLVAEAEQLSGSKEWGPTAGAFKRLMQEWKRAGRASRSDDDALWARFKTAQDAFFDAKDEVVAAEEAEFSENLKVKEALLVEAESITVDEAHLDQAKAELRRIQDRWDAAGKVPRNDIRRVEGRLRAVEQQVRDLEDSQWKRSDPELTARARSMVDQLERAVQGLESDLAAARAAGDDARVTSLESELATKTQWLDSARGGLG